MTDERTEMFLSLDAKLSTTLNEWREELTPEEIDTMSELRALIADRLAEERRLSRAW